MCKHVVYTAIVNFQMNIGYRRKIKNRKKKEIATTSQIGRFYLRTSETSMVVEGCHSEKKQTNKQRKVVCVL